MAKTSGTPFVVVRPRMSLALITVVLGATLQAALVASVTVPLEFLGALTGPNITYMRDGRYWDGDLAIPFTLRTNTSANESVYFIEGDSLVDGNTGPRLAPNSLGRNCSSLHSPVVCFQWQEDADGAPISLFPLLAESTVPAGVLYVEAVNKVFLFSMNVSNWGTGVPGSVQANGFLIEGTFIQDRFSFSPPVWQSQTNGAFVNAAPVLADDNEQEVYIFHTQVYRDSPIYLARTSLDSIAKLESFEHFAGFSSGQQPKWSSLATDAVPVFDDGPAGVGELSVIYSPQLQQYLLMYCAYDRDGENILQIRTADTAWGPWSAPVVLVHGGETLPWFETGWGGQYGGYMVPNMAPEEAEDDEPFVSFTYSLWVPYRAFLLRFNARYLAQAQENTRIDAAIL